MHVNIRAFTIQDIRDDADIFAKYEDPHGYFAEYDRLWVDLATSNPHAKATDLAVVFAEDNNQVVGRLGVYPGAAALGQAPVPAASLASFALEDAYKKGGAGGMLLLRVVASHKCLIASGGPSDEAYKLYLATGFRELGPLRRFIHVYRARHIVGRFVKHPRLSRWLSTCAQPLLSLYNRYNLGLRPFGHTLRYTRVERFSDALDELQRGQEKNHFPRNADTLNWALDHLNFMAYEISRGERPLGYVLLKRAKVGNDTTGYLADYHLTEETPQARLDLLHFCIEEFARMKVSTFECQMLDEAMVGACRRSKLLERQGHMVLFRPARAKKFDTDAEWSLTMASGDVLLYLGSLDSPP